MLRMPPGRHPLPREFITRHQRARIIAALADETVEKGYRSVTVADIVRRAGIARNTFYEELLPELVEFSLTPYIGPEAAKRTAGEAPAAPSG